MSSLYVGGVSASATVEATLFATARGVVSVDDTFSGDSVVHEKAGRLTAGLHDMVELVLQVSGFLLIVIGIVNVIVRSNLM